MESKKKQIHLRQKAYFERKLEDRLSSLSGKGIEAPKTDKDPLVKNLKASLKAVNNRLRLMAAHDQRTEEMAKAKADKAAAALKAKEGGEAEKAEKPKKAPEHGKEKKEKPKPEKKPAPPKAPEGGQGGTPA
jgi:hypothetical protein